MSVNWLFLILYLLFLIGCANQEDSEDSHHTESCKGEWVEKNKDGLVIRRFRESFVSDACRTDQLPLSNWEKELLERANRKTGCVPQSTIDNLWLVSANNYYQPRNGSIYMELDASTGQFRRITIGKTKTGIELFDREIGCWFEREDLEIEPVNPTSHGKMILLDLELGAASRGFHPMEVYNYSSIGSNYYMTRFDDQFGVDWSWCPTGGTPWEYCEELRNGKDMFYPDISSATTRAKLKAEALLIRSEYNWREISQSEFEEVWVDAVANRQELGTWEAIQNGYVYEYTIRGLVDVPMFIHRSWRNYLRREQPFMPDTDSISMPPICYPTAKEVTLSDGRIGYISGEACYVDGQYTFTQ